MTTKKLIRRKRYLFHFDAIEFFWLFEVFGVTGKVTARFSGRVHGSRNGGPGERRNPQHDPRAESDVSEAQRGERVVQGELQDRLQAWREIKELFWMCSKDLMYF